MNLQKAAEALEAKGYGVSVFRTAEEAAGYLNREIDGTTVGIGGSVTLEQMGVYESLSAHNQVYWHWRPEEGTEAEGVRRQAAGADIYLTSVNGLSETGEMVNIDGSGNRLASTLYGHKKVYFVIGSNKIEPDLTETIYRVRNVASPKNAQRLGCKTPCAATGDRCYDCRSDARICRAMVIHFEKMLSCDMEVVLVEESLGY